MCGICGLVKSNVSVSQDEISVMTDSMEHRGPDDSGTYCLSNIGLGHRRLSIIDVSKRGHQPMCDDKKSVYIVYNGELYNYLSIKADLQKRGYHFNSTTDTEVILNAFIEYGIQCAAMLDGIFSFAIYSRIDNTIHIARDRHGVKPLYYFAGKNSIGFSSEIKALHTLHDCPVDISDDSIVEFFLYRSISSTNTMYNNISELSPGTYLKINCNDMTSLNKTYLPGSKLNNPIEPSVRQINSLLEHSVQMQMVSDVTVGTMCSGGVDSSLITHFASLHANKPLHTFSVGFPSSKHDETKYAAFVSEKCKTVHTLLEAKPVDIIDNLEYLIHINDEPLCHYNSIYMYKIAKDAYSKEVKVLLSGEGADELFSGYRRSANILTIEKFLKYNILPNKLISSIATRIGKPKIVKMLSQYYKYNPDEFIALMLSVNSLANATAIFGSDKIRSVIKKRASLISAFGKTSLSEKLRMYDMTEYLPVLLMRQDKMTMAASVETRVPFLGNGVTQYAMRCSAKSFVQGRDCKWPLKQIAANEIGSFITDRRKVGFHIPFGSWLRTDAKLLQFTSEWLLCEQALYTKYVSFDYMSNTIKQHLSGLDRTEIIWTILCLEIWLHSVNQRKKPNINKGINLE